MRTSRAAVDEFLAKSAIAIVGASRTGRKFGNVAMRELRARGYRVYPIHPVAESIDAVPCYTRFEKLPQKARDYLKRLEEVAGCEIAIVSTGPDREHTIVLHNPFD